MRLVETATDKPRLTKLALHVIFRREAETAMELDASVRRLP